MGASPPFGARVAEQLTRTSTTQTELARTLGVSQQTVSKWITGETIPRPKHLTALEAALGLPKGELVALVFALDSAPPVVAAPSGPPPSVAALNRKMGTLTPDELAMVAAYVDAVVDARR